MRPLVTPGTRRGFTLFEVLVVLALLVLALGLLLPAVQKVREAAARIQCQNNLKQITLATINCADQHEGALPPAVGPYLKEASDETLFLHILPYLEQDNLYKNSADDKGNHSAWNNAVYSYRIKIYECPSDGSAGAAQLYDGWLATGSYAANFLALGTVSARFPASFTDGTSNTIVFTERYKVCNQTPCGWAFGGETEWAPVFDYSSIAKFQVQPSQVECNPALPQTAHSGGIQAALADGSVRVVSRDITAQTWYFACTPAGGEVLGSDW
jgi:prepilin-type N-terminal cleavage/methylation domain-containing protein